MSVQFAVHRRFTAEEFQRMGEAGIFSPDDRVELIDGEILEMTPAGSRHVACVIRLTRLFVELLGGGAVVSVQSPVQIDDARPLPDVAILRTRDDGYQDALPAPADCLLIVEVADSSVLFDRNVKSRLYARERIPEYWVIDLSVSTVVVHRAPEAEAYSVVEEHRRGRTFRSPALGGREFDVGELLGEAREG